MKSPPRARQWGGDAVAEPTRAELEAFVATNKRQRPFAWSRVEHLQRACRREASAGVADLDQPESVTTEESFA